jgi:hypothetical protein
LLQPGFSRQFLAHCQRLYVHTAIETCGHVPDHFLDGMLPYVDLVIFDYKLEDSAAHKTHTGVANHQVKKNLQNLLGSDKDVLVRMPLIPGTNDSVENIEAIGRFLETARAGTAFEVLPYHRLGESKYTRLDRPYALTGLKTPNESQMKKVADILSGFNLDVIGACHRPKSKKTINEGNMQNIFFEALTEKVRLFNKDGIEWHFHMLGPECVFSRSKDRFEIIVEIEATGEVISSAFSEKPVPETRQMAELCYGTEFLKKENDSDKRGPSDQKRPVNDAFMEIMDRARSCCASGASWHNHHLPPQCQFNPKKGKDCIVFEDETNGEALYAYYDDDPVTDLAELEKLFFDI